MSEGGPTQVDFNGLVAGLATSTVAVLSQVEVLMDTGDTTTPSEATGGESLSPEEARKRVADGLAGARQLIDTLAVLKEKTQGNLTAEEYELIDTSLGELRIRFVSLSSRSAE